MRIRVLLDPLLAVAALSALVACSDGGASAPIGTDDPPTSGSGSTVDNGAAPSTPGPSAPEADAGGTTATTGDDAQAAPPPPPPPVKKVLDLTWQGQETYYWCGPGSTRIALSTRLTTLPTQTTLAKELPTSTNGTDDISLVAAELNKRFGVTSYQARYLPDPPSAAQRAQLKSDLVSIIASGYPIVANVVSGWRPPTYPTTGTIYHYVAVVGYDASGDQAMIADPAAEGHGGSAAWNNVPRTYWISTQDLGTWIGAKGYTAQ